MVFDNFEEHAQHLYRYIYQGIKDCIAANRMDVQFKYSGDSINDPTAFQINLHHIGQWQLNYNTETQLVSLTSPLTYNTQFYKYDPVNDDWVHSTQPKLKDSLLLKLYKELDAHSEGYPRFGLEDHFYKNSKRSTNDFNSSINTIFKADWLERSSS